MPYGTGQTVTLVVIAKGDKAKEALDAGADFVGADELLEKIKGGWTEFSALVATPDMMRELGKLGKVLGPRGLMPTPKAGTVTTDVAKAVKELKAGKIEFKVDKMGIVNNAVGKLSFSENHLVENINAPFACALAGEARQLERSIFPLALPDIFSMGPGLKIDLQSIEISKTEERQ